MSIIRTPSATLSSSRKRARSNRRAAGGGRQSNAADGDDDDHGTTIKIDGDTTASKRRREGKQDAAEDVQEGADDDGSANDAHEDKEEEDQVTEKEEKDDEDEEERRELERKERNRIASRRRRAEKKAQEEALKRKVRHLAKELAKARPPTTKKKVADDAASSSSAASAASVGTGSTVGNGRKGDSKGGDDAALELMAEMKKKLDAVTQENDALKKKAEAVIADMSITCVMCASLTDEPMMNPHCHMSMSLMPGHVMCRPCVAKHCSLHWYQFEDVIVDNSALDSGYLHGDLPLITHSAAGAVLQLDHLSSWANTAEMKCPGCKNKAPCVVEEWCYPTGDQMAACYALVHYQKTTTGEGGTNAGGTTADSKSSQVKEGSETKYKSKEEIINTLFKCEACHASVRGWKEFCEHRLLKCGERRVPCPIFSFVYNKATNAMMEGDDGSAEFAKKLAARKQIQAHLESRSLHQCKGVRMIPRRSIVVRSATGEIRLRHSRQALTEDELGMIDLHLRTECSAPVKCRECIQWYPIHEICKPKDAFNTPYESSVHQLLHRQAAVAQSRLVRVLQNTNYSKVTPTLMVQLMTAFEEMQREKEQRESLERDGGDSEHRVQHAIVRTITGGTTAWRRLANEMHRPYRDSAEEDAANEVEERGRDFGYLGTSIGTAHNRNSDRGGSSDAADDEDDDVRLLLRPPSSSPWLPEPPVPSSSNVQVITPSPASSSSGSST